MWCDCTRIQNKTCTTQYEHRVQYGEWWSANCQVRAVVRAPIPKQFCSRQRETFALVHSEYLLSRVVTALSVEKNHVVYHRAYLLTGLRVHVCTDRRRAAQQHGKMTSYQQLIWFYRANLTFTTGTRGDVLARRRHTTWRHDESERGAGVPAGQPDLAGGWRKQRLLRAGRRQPPST